jgi:putative ABC transport system substrate-binding protein
MRRRDFIAGLGIAATWSIRAKSAEGAPVIGFVAGGSLAATQENVDWVLRGLLDAGFVEGRNFSVEYRWADDRYERLPALVGDLVRRQVAMIVAVSTATALAAKAATQSIPIVFAIGTDPIDLGLVPSFNRPGGNVTGIATLFRATSAKRLQLLYELVPEGRPIAYLVNPAQPFFAEPETRDLQEAARTLGVRLLILNATNLSEFEPAFATVVRERAGGLIVGSDTLFYDHFDRIVALAARYHVPVVYFRREAAFAGGLISYGTDLHDMWRQVGAYVGRILKGEKPADLPVIQATKVQLIINLKTAKTLGITFPTGLLVRADEVIE